MKTYIAREKTTRRIIHQIYAKSGIRKRHTVIDDFNANGNRRLFFQKDGSLTVPSTGRRNQRYTDMAKPLFAETARKTIAQNVSFQKDDITHIITVSCTGFFAPEPGFEIIKQLDLHPSTERFHIGFMGCFAAFPAMKMARSFCEARPDAVVLIVCLELCTLHLQDSETADHLISASVFADGAAGMIISNEKPRDRGFKLHYFSSAIAEKTEQEMAWTIGDTGFEMMLSSYVPDVIQLNLPAALQPILDSYSITLDAISHWAIHPGGRAILDKIQQNFELEDSQLAASRQVLSRYGNMSSATILFVLARLLEMSPESNESRVVGMAFGPGLTIESALFTRYYS